MGRVAVFEDEVWVEGWFLAHDQEEHGPYSITPRRAGYFRVIVKLGYFCTEACD
jgi:hypothetical protein